MTAITTLRGTRLYIKVENDSSPATFAHPCLINTRRGIQFRSNLGKIITPDCDNPDDPAWEEAVKDALSAAITGEGVLDNKLATIQFYDAWWRSSTPKMVQVWLGTMGYWLGAFHLGSWEISGERGQHALATLSMESDGQIAAFAAA